MIKMEEREEMVKLCVHPHLLLIDEEVVSCPIFLGLKAL